MSADLPLIAWAEVPDKAQVWWRWKGNKHWEMGHRRFGYLCDRIGSHQPYTEMEFLLAEQQPGEWAKERAALVNRSLELQAQSLTHYVAVTRLRDGLAALEQAVDAYLNWLNDTGQSLDQEFKNRRGRVVTSACSLVAALREGR